MSHSKMTKRGRSQYIEKWNPSSKKYINTCVICGAQGYKPSIEEDDFVRENIYRIDDLENAAIRSELKKIFLPLPLDELNRCNDCAKRMDKQK
ncbi:MAG: hypothetical protein IKL36_03565 [Clostridia bacterium]|nr:hypothetical protein [Clostridia bacterium]